MPRHKTGPTRRVSVCLPEGLYWQLRDCAVDSHDSLNHTITLAVAAYIRRWDGLGKKRGEKRQATLTPDQEQTAAGLRPYGYTEDSIQRYLRGEIDAPMKKPTRRTAEPVV